MTVPSAGDVTADSDLEAGPARNGHAPTLGQHGVELAEAHAGLDRKGVAAAVVVDIGVRPSALLVTFFLVLSNANTGSGDPDFGAGFAALGDGGFTKIARLCWPACSSGWSCIRCSIRWSKSPRGTGERRSWQPP